MNDKQIISNSKRIVIKIGTTQITEEGKVSAKKITALSKVISKLKKNYEIIIVTSGAVSAGISEAKLQVKKSLSIPYKQAAAAIGQTCILQLYREIFSKLGNIVGQILLTKDVMQNRERYLNAKNTFITLLKIGTIPIVNENDTIAIDEIKVGDNDRLAAMVAQIAEADLLILLSDIDGFYENFEDPEKRKIITEVKTIDKSLRKMALNEGSQFSTGGMITKLDAAEMCMNSGISTIIANGKNPEILYELLQGKGKGTIFSATSPKLTGRKHWIKHHLVKRGTIQVDDGAKEAIKKRGTSLLPKGIIKVKGNFDTGDGISIVDSTGIEFSTGITNYGREDLIKIIGKNSDEIEIILGYKSFDEVIHRDNLVIIKK